jgi:hypothetical protein
VAYDVFISYSSKDKPVADAVCARMESAGIRCWIALRDIVAGTSYGEAIIDAIHEAKVMVLVFSSNANSSGHIPKEVERAVSRGVVIIPFRIEDVAPGKSLDYFIGSVHWLDAMTPPLEKHLDDLASTVHKLLPAKAGEQGAPALQASATWQRSAPAIAPIGAVRSAAGGAPARASSSKTIWIGLAAVAVLAAVVLGAMLLRGGGNTPETPNPSPLLVVNPNPGPTPGTGDDPIMGCFQWTNNSPVVIHANHTLVAGALTARWEVVNAAQRAYQFTWPRSTDTVTISSDQRSLSGTNQYGALVSGARISGSSGLVGIWNWSYSVPGTVPPVTVYPNGTYLAGTAQGLWQPVDASHGIYALTWSDPPRDSVTLSADGSRISGVDQWGLTTSAVRAESCAGN